MKKTDAMTRAVKREKTKAAKLKKCMICGQPVDKDKEEDHWAINGAVAGDFIEIRGHAICRENVNRLIVVPNRRRVGR